MPIKARVSGWCVVMTLIGSLGAADSAPAQVLERVLMPGPVVEGHADYENECSRCHQPFSRDLQRELCVDCHTEIGADIREQNGFHGRSATIPTLECASCHTEHEGRDADIVGFDPDTFDHSTADFALAGAHLTVPCESCHAETSAFRDAETACYGCHRADDPHKGNLGESCASCHAETRWSAARFDHATTDFALDGLHADVPCGGCHRNERYADSPTECVDCHRVDDAHAGRNGTACGDCHSPAGWTDSRFDHFQATGFALDDGHGGLTCGACHGDARFERNPDPKCYACHRPDDTHAGRNGTECDTCHSPTAWTNVSFDHARDSGFALEGAHADLVCAACHRGPVESMRPDSACVACHWSDDAHGGRLGESCGDCHGVSGWPDSVRFDHDLTTFPLLGLHSAVACESCHEDAGFVDTPDRCVDCHRDDDVHALGLGADCGACHNPNDWLIWRFDHDRQTDFPLDGAHSGLDCLACHNRPATDSAALPMRCGGCHRGDDIHAAAFGTDCGRCHTTEAFTDLR